MQSYSTRGDRPSGQQRAQTRLLQEEEKMDGNTRCCLVVSYFLMVIFFPFSLICSFQCVRTYERAAVLRLGKVMRKSVGPGAIHVLPCTDKVIIIDMREQFDTIYLPSVLSKDSVTLAVNAVVFYRVTNAISVALSVQGYKEFVKLMAQSALRNAIGRLSFAELQTHRDLFIRELLDVTDQAVTPYGVHINRVEIVEIRIPNDMKSSMAAEAAAKREARAKVILADAEQKSAQALKEASEILNKSPVTVQLRYFQTMRESAKDRQHSVAFPIPIELSPFLGAELKS